MYLLKTFDVRDPDVGGIGVLLMSETVDGTTVW